jgi:hypothetical protein
LKDTLWAPKAVRHTWKTLLETLSDTSSRTTTLLWLFSELAISYPKLESFLGALRVDALGCRELLLFISSVGVLQQITLSAGPANFLIWRTKSLLFGPRASVFDQPSSPLPLSSRRSSCMLLSRLMRRSFLYHQTVSTSIKQVLWSSGYDSRLGFATAINCERSPVRVRARPCSFAFVWYILLILVLLVLVRQARSRK